MTAITLSRAAAEPLVQYLDFKKTFNSQFKVSVAAILHVTRIVSGSGGTRIMQGLVADTGEPWSKDFNWTDPAADLQAALRDTTRLGIFQVHSAADDLLTGFQADLQRWSAFRGLMNQTPDAGTQEKLDPLEQFFTISLGGAADRFDKLRPVLLYFRLARNCIAHRSSSASGALAEISSDSSVQSALLKWPKRAGATIPPLPSFTTGAKIDLLPRHAILALEAVYRAADEINKQFVRIVGVEGLTYLAAHHVLFVDSVVGGLTAYKSVEAVLADAVTNRYGVIGFRSADVSRVLKELNIRKECTRAFEQLYGQPPQPRISKAGHVSMRGKDPQKKR